MDQLQQARAQIDEIDAKMAALFEQRMQAVGQVAQYKARTGKQVFDPAREALVLEKNTARVQNPELQPYYREFLKEALAVSRAYQHVLIGQDVAGSVPYNSLVLDACRSLSNGLFAKSRQDHQGNKQQEFCWKLCGQCQKYR